MTRDPSESEDGAFMKWLDVDCKYVAPMQIGRHWVACERLLFHASLIMGDMNDYDSVSFRYCYPTMLDAQIGMATWVARGCAGEPEGWHKRRSLPVDYQIAEDDVLKTIRKFHPENV